MKSALAFDKDSFELFEGFEDDEEERIDNDAEFDGETGDFDAELTEFEGDEEVKGRRGRSGAPGSRGKSTLFSRQRPGSRGRTRFARPSRLRRDRPFRRGRPRRRISRRLAFPLRRRRLTVGFPPEETLQGAEYIRWVQASLNRVLALRLPVNGILGPETRSAVRRFQERERLPVTGIVGPDTEGALIAALAGIAPALARVAPAEPAEPEPSDGAALARVAPTGPAEPEPSEGELADLEFAGQVERRPIRSLRMRRKPPTPGDFDTELTEFEGDEEVRGRALRESGSLGQDSEAARLSVETGLDREFIADFLYAHDVLTRPRFPGTIDPRGIPFLQIGVYRTGIAWALKEYVLPGFGIVEGIIGKDILTGRELTALERWLGIVGDAFGLLPIGRAMKPASRAFGRGARLAGRSVKLAGRIVGQGAARWAAAAVQLGVAPSRMLRYLGRIRRLPPAQVAALRAHVKQARAAGRALRLPPAERRLLQDISNAGRELRGQAPSGRVLGPPASAAPAAVAARAALARIASRANTACAILSVLRTRVFWRSGPHSVFMTRAGQLVGTHAALRRFVETYRRAGRRVYARWHSHHIVEEVHLRNLGVRNHFPSRDELPAVLLPSTGHSQRLRSLLGPADTLRLTPQQLLEDHYKPAYRLLGAYTGMGSERQIAAELSAVAGRTLGLQ